MLGWLLIVECILESFAYSSCLAATELGDKKKQNSCNSTMPSHTVKLCLRVCSGLIKFLLHIIALYFVKSVLIYNF